MAQMRYIACDLGAESGRLMLGTLEDGRLTLEEIHRFPNGAVERDGHLCWDLQALQTGLSHGLRKIAARRIEVQSISTDSWGVDYVLFDEHGRIIEPVFHYRDRRCEEGVKRVFSKVPWEKVFELTGIQFMQLNTIFQLAAEEPQRLQRAKYMLGIADAFNHWLGAKACYEESLASTTQLYDPVRRCWSAALIDELGFPRHIFPEVVPSGTVVGEIRGDFAGLFGSQVVIVASCSHDTGAAVAAVPAEGRGWAYLSSGTWSLMGVELLAPIISDEAREHNFTNELGFGGTVRFLKNIIGLWLLQECRRDWERIGYHYDYSQLTELAEEAEQFRSLIDPSDPRFLPPGRMVERIQDFCRETNQAVPDTIGRVVRCILESLALFYRYTVKELEAVTGTQISRLHIVGGGSKNRLLNQFTANALQVPVLTGPTEATATGNVLIQAITTGIVKDLAEARKIVRGSFDIGVVEPKDKERWDEAYERFLGLIERSRKK